MKLNGIEMTKEEMRSELQDRQKRLITIAIYNECCHGAGSRCWEAEQIERAEAGEPCDVWLACGTSAELRDDAEITLAKPASAANAYARRCAKTILEALS